MNKKLIPLLLVSFTNTIGFSILIPVLPFLAEQYHAGPVLYGALLAIYSVFQFFGSPILGALSDMYGRKPILLLSHGGTFLGWLLFIASLYLPNITIISIALPLIGIGLARALDGATGGNISVASASLSDSVKPEDRAHAFGIMGATFGFGMLIGPVLGGLVMATSYGFVGVGIVASIVSLITLGLIYFWLPESHGKEKRSEKVAFNLRKELNIVQRVAKYADDKQIRTLFIVRTLFSLAFVGYVSIYIFHAIHYFNLSRMESAQLMMFTGAFLIFNQLFAVKYFVKKFGESKTFTLGQLCMMTALFLLSVAHTIPLFVGEYYLLNLGVSLSMMTFQSLLVRSVLPQQRGEIMGIAESLVALVQSVVPILAGILYAAISIGSFAVFAVMNLLVLLVIFRQSNTYYLQLTAQEIE